MYFCVVIFTFFDSQVEETDEARKKFSNAKSISSAQYFGDQNKAAIDGQVSLQKFSVCALTITCKSITITSSFYFRFLNFRLL